MIDLHVHSSASDGTFSAEALVEMAHNIGLRALALTDHDTLSGLDAFLEAARAYPDMEAIPGVEISVSLPQRQEAHLVGLFIDHRNAELCTFLEQLRVNRNARNAEMVARLQANGYEITLEELREECKGESIGRPGVAALLVRKGYFQTLQAVFDACLKRGSRCYVARKLPSAKEGIEAIHKAGGVAIWAHPVYRRNNERHYVRMQLNFFRPLNLDGVETFYTVFSEAQHDMMRDFAALFGLLESGGTDFHGLNHPDVSMGRGFGALSVPDELLEPIRIRARQYAGTAD